MLNPFEKSWIPARSIFGEYPSQAARKQWMQNKSFSDDFFPWKVIQSFWEILKPTQEWFRRMSFTSREREEWIKQNVLTTCSGEKTFNPFEESYNPLSSAFEEYPSQAERKEWIENKSCSDYFFRWKVFQSFSKSETDPGVFSKNILRKQRERSGLKT